MTSRAQQIAALSLPLDQLPDPLPIPTIERPFDVTIRPPGSKSITNRALLLAALAEGTSELRGPLIDADDAQVMLRAIEQLGAKVTIVRAREMPHSASPHHATGGTGDVSASDGANLDVALITGVGGRWNIPAGQTVALNLNNAGTATRFLTAAAVLAPPSTSIVIDGDLRMRQRPIAELADALRVLGVRVEFLGAAGCPPIRITPPDDLRTLAASVAFNDPQSSQFISAMLLVAPFLPRALAVKVAGRVLSEPYIAMTRSILGELMLEQKGPRLRGEHHDGVTTLHTPSFRLRGFRMDVEPDASGATYFLAAAALVPGARCVIDGLPWVVDCEPLQGDAMFGGVLDAAGADERADADSTACTGRERLLPLTWDFSDMPDTAMTAGVLAAFASPTSTNPDAVSTLSGLRTLRVKETDRIDAMRKELSKIGAAVQVFAENGNEGVRITPPAASDRQSSPVAFDTYHDHRMAMSLALVGLRRPNVLIRDPRCVAKTYPTFWADLAKLYV